MIMDRTLDNRYTDPVMSSMASGPAIPPSQRWALASTGPGYEATQNVGEAGFVEAAAGQARELVRDGLPLRAPIAVVGYLARKPTSRREVAR